MAETLAENMAAVFGAVIFGPPTYDLADLGDLADAIGVTERGLAAMRTLYCERVRELNADPLRQAVHEAGAAGANAAAAKLRQVRKRGRKPRAASTTNGEATPPGTPLFPETAAA